ncbi:MAG: hypothetical protein AB7O74_12035 [Candidatus Nanopelagicales bacterium]
MSPAPRRRVVRAAGAAVLVVLLAACGSNLAGNALSAGPTSVSDAQLSAIVDELQQQLVALKQQSPTFDEGTATGANVDRLMRQALLDQAAAREGIEVTQGEVDTILQQVADANFGGDMKQVENALAEQQNIPASQIDGFARAYLVQQKLGAKLAPGKDATEQQKAVVAYLDALATDVDAQVAPRFGVWNAKTASLTPVPDDLSVLAPLPTE